MIPIPLREQLIRTQPLRSIFAKYFNVEPRHKYGSQ
jgi:hypothetical protein